MTLMRFRVGSEYFEQSLFKPVGLDNVDAIMLRSKSMLEYPDNFNQLPLRRLY